MSIFFASYCNRAGMYAVKSKRSMVLPRGSVNLMSSYGMRRAAFLAAGTVRARSSSGPGPAGSEADAFMTRTRSNKGTTATTRVDVRAPCEYQRPGRRAGSRTYARYFPPPGRCALGVGRAAVTDTDLLVFNTTADGVSDEEWRARTQLRALNADLYKFRLTIFEALPGAEMVDRCRRTRSPRVIHPARVASS